MGDNSLICDLNRARHTTPDLRKMSYAYSGVAFNNYKEYIKDKPIVNLKKLLFVFRNAMCLKRIIDANCSPEVTYTELAKLTCHDALLPSAMGGLDLKTLGITELDVSESLIAQSLIKFIEGIILVPTLIDSSQPYIDPTPHLDEILRKHLFD